MSGHVLLCDFSIGASVQMALTEPGKRPPEATNYSCPSRKAFDDAVVDFLREQGNPPLLGAAISSRGYEIKGVLQLPQAGISIVRDDVRELLNVRRINIVNNFVARALAIPRLNGDEMQKLCGGERGEDQVVAVLGPHHGLGCAALAPDGGGSWTAIPCEGGHVDLPVTNVREEQVCRVLRDRFGHVSREHALSLDGLVNLWSALSVIESDDAGSTTPEEIIAKASIGDPRSAEAVSMCTGWLASMASDVALMLGARGGIYLTGDLVDLLADIFDADAFARRYADKGRLSDYIGEIPVYRTLAKDMEIIGLATLFD